MKITYKILIILPLLLMILSCGSNKVNVPVDEVIQATPCFGAGYFSTKDAFRASAIGESMDQMTARKKAMANARQELATSISATINIVGDNYVKSTEVNNVEEVLELFEENARTVINQQLSGAKSICDRMMVTQSGKYKYYIALELSGDNIVKDYYKSLSKNDKIMVDYNYEKFKETFEKEMENM